MFRPLPVLAAALFAATGLVQATEPEKTPAAPAAAASAATLGLEASPRFAPLPRAASPQLPIVLQARSINSRPDRETVAEGDVELRRGGLVLRAQRLSVDHATELARATGGVSIAREGAIYSGTELEIALARFEGYFLDPRFTFTELGAGGRAERIEFLGEKRSRALQAEYTSCPREEGEEPAWVLKTRSVELDLAKGEGRAEGAVLRFQGLPILALPALSFPLGDERKSGWLPPSINIDNRSGLVVAVPWYWNIAPNRDATLAPRIITRRGIGLDSEFRYLQPRYEGAVRLDALPKDQVARRSRAALQWLHDAEPAAQWRANVDVVRVSDDAWWKDFPDAGRSFMPRVLHGRAALERSFALPAVDGEANAYARVLRWQLLQDSESFIRAPYERSPQIGLAAQARVAGFELALESEFNRFTLPEDQDESLARPSGDRWHTLASVARPWRGDGWFVVPKLGVNAAVYDNTRNAVDGMVRARRAIPTFSLDLGLELERRTVLFGRDLRQTLEPRLLYVQTPFKPQSQLPNYDAAAKDFNIVSLYTDNAFSGVDRVADAKQLTAGFTTRLVDATSGAEALRLGLVQRVLFRAQRVAPQADGSPDGPALEQRLSDALLVGSTSVLPNWSLDAAVQYSPDIGRSVRSILGARYSPGPFRTVNATYRLARGLSEQLEVGWQWPLAGAVPGTGQAVAADAGRSSSGGGACRGAWYSVGRFNYSLKDQRLTDSILGLEYDAGCWIVRVVGEQLSTGRSQATTRILLQLELVGLSRLGSNPLQVLRDNIPGYRLLRDERARAPAGEAGPTP